MAAFQNYNKILVSQDDIEQVRAGDTVIGYEFKCQYPSYRGTFLSCIERLEIEVDGRPVDPETVYFHINGKQFLLAQLEELYGEYWFVLDKAVIRVMRDGGLAPGGHAVTVKMRHRIPYTGYFGQYMVLDGACTKTLRAV